MVPTLLLVDDDPIFRSLATEILLDLGIELIEYAGSAETAIAKAQSLRPEAALVDVGLPDQDGIELAQEIAALPWSPAVVLISADRDAAAGIERSAADGGLAFIPKDELPDAPLRRLLRLE
jgi:two-component system nitrate/nitrite response regulator NarL